MSSVTTLASSDLFPVSSVPFNSARDTATGRGSCVSTDGKSTGRPSSCEVISRQRTFLSAFITVF